MPSSALFASRDGTLVSATANGSVVGTAVYNHPPPPVLLGGLIALFLSGVVFMQVVLYFQLYPTDRLRTKSIVVAVWMLDIVHSALVCTANWENLIVEYGNYSTLDAIQWSISLTIAFTAITTTIVHCFFIHRIWKLSRGNWWITLPLYLVALLRTASAFVTTAEMLRLKSYVLFIQEFSYIFTLGLALSASLDVFITSVLCYYIRRGRPGFARVNHTIDALTLYIVENGMLTCIATLLSLFFWLFMRRNFAFLGLHLAINKLYANSLLASLNARKSLASRMAGSTGERYPLPVMLHNPTTDPRTFTRGHGEGAAGAKPLHVTIDVECTIQHDGTTEIASAPGSDADVNIHNEFDAPHKSGGDLMTDVKTRP